VLAPAPRAERRDEVRRQPHHPAVPCMRLHRRPRPVGGHLQDRRPVQPLPPPGEHLLAAVEQRLLFQPHMLVERLARKAETRRAAAGLLAVERRELAHEHRERPEIRHDVMDDQQHHRPAHRPTLVARPQAHPQQRPLRQIEGPPRLLRQPRPQLHLAPPRHILPPEDEIHPLGHPPLRLAVHHRKRRPQRRMAIHQHLHRALQRSGLDGRRHPRRRRDVVRPAGRREMVDEPDRALSLGEGREGAGINQDGHRIRIRKASIYFLHNVLTTSLRQPSGGQGQNAVVYRTLPTGRDSWERWGAQALRSPA